MSSRKKLRVPLSLVVLAIGVGAAGAVAACGGEVCKEGDACATGGAGGSGTTVTGTANQTSSPAG